MAEMFAEGYLKEVRFMAKDATCINILIDPAPPFALEYKDKRYTLALLDCLLDINGGESSNDKKVILFDVDKTWMVDRSVCLSSLIAIKTSHAKCRFCFNGKLGTVTSKYEYRGDDEGEFIPYQN